jgi:hypothetical protein
LEAGFGAGFPAAGFAGAVLAAGLLVGAGRLVAIFETPLK